ncbi:MlaC/ttg2D family ABC transporter substrate-binding protein [Swingsia samuiensis]|uniref:ABC transporter substrate-binding protein n=1 Tax=Swingsia samuiensis TaxID=1293412 RepID=A0A4Y6UHM0_9PROT|nr:ABC transporter substrate-binding protein [Swingsia samuiensis]QDH17089.1 ABC transporter substrate-binding protein [Swingsia samuiensis]
MIKVFSRRALLGAFTLSLAFGSGVAQASPATDFVNSFGSKLLNIVNSSQSLEAKQQAVLPLLQSNVDIQGIARYCLGRYWRTATPEQRQKYVGLFSQVLMNTVTGQIGNYQGVKFHVTGSVQTPDGERVDTVIDRPNQPTVTLQLIVNGQPPKIIDMYGEGASLRMNQRGDYSSYLAHHGGNVDSLISALERQVNGHH